MAQLLGFLTPDRDKDKDSEPEGGGASTTASAVHQAALTAKVDQLGTQVDALSEKFDSVSSEVQELNKSHANKMDAFTRQLEMIATTLTNLQRQGSLVSAGGEGGVGLEAQQANGSTNTRVNSVVGFQEPSAADIKETKKKEAAAKRRETVIAKYAKEEVFGMTPSRQSEMEADQRKRCFNLRQGIVLPQSVGRQTWDLIFIIALVYIILLVPYRIAFVTEHVTAYAVIDFLLDIFFIGDIFLNFMTAYNHPDTGVLITKHTMIAKHYTRTWLLPDLVSSIPYDWFILGIKFTEDGAESVSSEADQEFAQLPQLLRVIKCVKLLRLLRVARAGVYIQKFLEWAQLEVILNSNVLRLLSVSAFMTLFAHWNACFQYLLASLDGDVVYTNGTSTVVFNPDSWVARMIQDGSIREDLSNAWVWSFYGAWMQMLAIAVGLKEPRRSVEMWGTLISILFGSVIYALFLASLTTALAESDQSAKEYRKKLNMMNEYMKYAQVPKKMRNQMREYYELYFPARRSFDEDSILSELSKPLRSRVALYKCRTVLDSLELVSADSDAERNGLMEAISLNLERVLYVAGDYVIRAGDEANGMFFISKGSASVLKPGNDEEVLTTLGKGSFFGEGALLRQDHRTSASVKVEEYCDGFYLSQEAFGRLVGMYPSFKAYLTSVAKLRSGDSLKRQSTVRLRNVTANVANKLQVVGKLQAACSAVQAVKMQSTMNTNQASPKSVPKSPKPGDQTPKSPKAAEAAGVGTVQV